MQMEMLGAVVRSFLTEGAFVDAEPHGSGHINDSFRVTCVLRGARRRYLLQRMNTHVFAEPGLLMENMHRVTKHLAMQMAGAADAERRVLKIVPALDGRAWHDDETGAWRMFPFIENARSFDTVTSIPQAFEVASAFGNFQGRLADLPAPRLHETIPGFHDTPQRFAALERAMEADTARRTADALPEIAFALAHRRVASALLDANLPERVTHNDTKLNNVLFDAATGEALCVVDLDTVMPGLALYDFGDMVRTATSGTPEDEQDLTRVEMQFPFFEALVRGYLSTTRSFLTSAEIECLPLAGKVITFEQGLRFLTDFLEGDRYYKTTRPTQNLDRCRTQWKLVTSMERQEAVMQQLVRSV